VKLAFDRFIKGDSNGDRNQHTSAQVIRAIAVNMFQFG
jgi:hypothetical protein